MAGYSANPLHKKLGLKAGMKVLLIGAPLHYTELLGDDYPPFELAKTGDTDLDFVHLFTNSVSVLTNYLESLKKQIHPNGAVWVSWYKKSAKVPTEITEDIIRKICLPRGWVDVKVCAVDEQWSGLKLVIPLKNRDVSLSSPGSVSKK